MKSTAEASSGCSIQTVQISPVVTGTLARALDPLDDRDQFADARFAAQIVSLPTMMRVDVAVVAGEFDRRTDFPLVALLVLVDPGADRDLQAEFRGDAGTSSAPPVDE